MRIIRLEAQNIMRLEAVDVTPSEFVVKVSGENESGKSSLLNAIFFALAGKSNHPGRPVRDGAETASIRLTLGEHEPERIVTVRFNPSGPSLSVESMEGAVFKRPQQLLDSLVGGLTFDPLAFSILPKKEQLEALRKVVTVDVDLDAIDRQRAETYTRRTDINREVTRLHGLSTTLQAHIDPEMDVEPLDVAALVAELGEVGARNTEMAQRRAGMKAIQRKQESLAVTIEDIKTRIAALQQSLEKAEAELAAVNEEYVAFPPIGPDIDGSDIQARITAAMEENARRDVQARRRAEYGKVVDELTAAKVHSDVATEDIALLDSAKRVAIEAAKMPVDGLSFGDGEITYNGLPFDQASTAVQIKVAVGIGMAVNPKLRILCIREGSLLDDKSMAVIAKMAEDNDMQVWIECVSSHATTGIHMVEGSVAAIDGVPVPKPQTGDVSASR
jgi:energy-coupling factor transporter ATP-binding protein EcfA2